MQTEDTDWRRGPDFSLTTELGLQSSVSSPNLWSEYISRIFKPRRLYDLGEVFAQNVFVNFTSTTSVPRLHFLKRLSCNKKFMKPVNACFCAAKHCSVRVSVQIF